MKRVLLGLVLLAHGLASAAETISGFPDFKAFPDSTLHSAAEPGYVAYQLGLGAMQKVRGRWRLKNEERIHGYLARYTWSIDEGYTADEGLEWLRQQFPAASLLFECDGRSCGSSAQWASRVFEQRVLYGHDERQRYVALRLEVGGEIYSLALYAVDRANRRHYVHLDVLRHGKAAGS